MQAVEQTILRHLIHNEEFSRKASPFLRSEYFSDRCDKVVYEMVSHFISTYNSLPATEALYITLNERKDLSQSEFDGCSKMLETLKEKPEEVKQDWLFDTTEKFCQQRAVYNAIMESIQIIDGKSKSKSENATTGFDCYDTI